MQYDILHAIPGRLRVACRFYKLSPVDAYAIQELLLTQEGILAVRVSARTGSILIHYSRQLPQRQIEAMLHVMTPDDWDGFDVSYEARPSLLEEATSAIFKTGINILFRMFLPWPIRYGWTLINALPSLAKGVASLGARRLDLAVLDATALTIMALRRDFSAMRMVLLLFSAAEALKDWTQQESRKSLADCLALKIDSVWIRRDNSEVQIRLADVVPGMEVVVRTGSIISIDGIVIEGEALVNEALLTGESDASHKYPGISVYAGTVLEEGRLIIKVEKATGQTHLQDIVNFIEQSESLKAEVQSRAERLADAMVPYNLALSLLVLVLTRSPLRAASALMVDYSCAIRMATPLTILSAIREGIQRGVLVKGGKYLEELAYADCLVLDKTGTLTSATPKVATVIPFGNRSAKEILRLAACIEEHFPHPVARAVVRQAEREKLKHREQHAEPEYILAHGIVSKLLGQQVLIGSEHFIFEDRGLFKNEIVQKTADAETSRGRSVLYLAVGGEVIGLLSIEDPIRPEAAAVLTEMQQNGIRRVSMLTGDSERTARAVADTLGLDEYHARLLPTDKAQLIHEIRSDGFRVMFVGDGMNDSPALSAANVGVSLKDGADLAKEVAGVVLMDGRFGGLIVSRLLAVKTMERMNWQFSFIMVANTALMALGLGGLISPRLAALLHNLTTVAVTANSIRSLLPEEDRQNDAISTATPVHLPRPERPNQAESDTVSAIA